MLAPPAFLIFGINLCDATASQLLSYAGPALLASLVATQFFYGRVRWPFISQLYEVLQSFYLARGLVEVVRKPRSPTFKVTPKGEMLDRHFISSLSTPFYIFLALTSASIAMGFYRLSVEAWSATAVGFVMFWAILDLTLLLGALGVLLEKKQTRSEPRVARVEPVTLTTADGRQFFGESIDLSANGAGVRLHRRTLKRIRKRHLRGVKDALLQFPTLGTSFPVDVLNLEREDLQHVTVGLRYRLESVLDERNAIRLAFGSSDLIEKNNRHRHGGRSILHGLITVMGFGLIQGRDHFLFWLRSQWYRVLPKKIDERGQSI